MRSTLTSWLNRRFATIQGRHNFDPKLGARQVRHLQATDAFAYGRFKELRNLARKLRLRVAIPFDPSGKNPAERRASLSTRAVHVYFARKEGTQHWKIGSSINPHTRVRGVATGNDGSLDLRHVVMKIDGRRVERQLKRRLRPYKTRDRNDPIKGEWFNLDSHYVKNLVKYLRAGKNPERSPLP